MQAAFIDRDAIVKANGTTTAPNSNTNLRRPLGVYTRVRLSDYLLEVGRAMAATSPSSSQSSILPSTIPHQYADYILELDFSHHQLASLPSASTLGRFSNLRKLTFHDNRLTKLGSGLEKLTKLEELSFEENHLTDLTGLTHLTHLTKLDLGKNRLTAIDFGSTFAGLESSLAQLSLEENRLTSLQGIGSLTSLMELYLSNNSIATLRELVFLKDLPRLLILDLTGNPVTTNEKDYRLWAVYHFKKLKVLDGLAIDANELTAARDLYAGRLTEELLNEILGHSFYKHIENLDLSGAKIRNCEVINSDRFGNLRVLVLDNNHLTDVTSLSPLPLLRVLRLNRNRIAAVPMHDASGKGWLGKCFPSLEVLELGYNKIVSIPALNLKGLNELRVLTLEANEIAKVEGLHHLTNLQQLVLAKNKIKRFELGGTSTGSSSVSGSFGSVPTLTKSSFAGLSELRGLQLEENGLRSLAGIGTLPKLRALFLAYNRLTELSEFEHIASDRCSAVLQEVTLRNNPLARKHLYRPTLIRRLGASIQVIDGREVTQEEREKAEQIFANSSSVAMGSNGEPLINLAPGGMPTSGIYFYSDQPRLPDKVPLKVQSFNIAGFAEPTPSPHHHQQQQQQAQGSSAYHANSNPSPHSLGIGGIGIGGIAMGVAQHHHHSHTHQQQHHQHHHHHHPQHHGSQSHHFHPHPQSHPHHPSHSHMNLNIGANMALSGPSRQPFTSNSNTNSVSSGGGGASVTSSPLMSPSAVGPSSSPSPSSSSSSSLASLASSSSLPLSLMGINKNKTAVMMNSSSATKGRK